MNRIPIILLLPVFAMCLISCSSKNKSSGVDESMLPPQQQNVVEESAAPVSANNAVPSSGVVQTPKATSNQSNPLYIKLSQAIQAQDENGILKEGSVLLMKNPNDLKAMNAMSMAYYKKGQYPLAKSLLQKAIKIDSKAHELYSNLGIINLALGEDNDAIKNFKKSIELNPNDYVGASNAGSLYVRDHDFGKAAVVLEMAYSKGYRNSKVLSNYGVSLTAIGKYEKADKIYREALKDNNNNKEILFNHAILLIQHLKKLDEGREIVKKLKFLGVPEESRKKLQELETLSEVK